MRAAPRSIRAMIQAPPDIEEEMRSVAANLRVAVVHDWLNGMRGGEKVLEQILEVLPGAEVFTLFHEPEKLSPALRAAHVHESEWTRRFPAARRHYRRLLPLMPWMAGQFPTQDFDLVVSTSHCVAKGAPPPTRGANLAYIHSPMRYVWDHFDDYLSGKWLQDTALRAVRAPLQRWDRESSRQLDGIAANSAHIAGKIREFWGRRSRVIHPPVDLETFTPGDREEPRDYFLIVSALVPYKRVDRAIDAAKRAGVRLVVVGDGPERDALRRRAGRGVTFRGWVGTAELVELYRGCRAFLYPGVEDFGITALEAQACGRPVLAFGHGGVTETVVDGVTGAFFHEPEVGALEALLTAHDASLYRRSAIRRHAEEFSPARFRAELAEWMLEEVRLRC